jgi:hypothetical protein
MMSARRLWSAYDDGRLSSMWVDLTLKLEDICVMLDRGRNSVCGRAHFLKLPKRSVVRSGHSAARKGAGRKPKPKGGRVGFLAVNRALVRGCKILNSWPVAPASAVPLMEVKHGHCLFPYDGGLFCAHPVVRGCYCASHAAVCFKGAGREARL